MVAQVREEIAFSHISFGQLNKYLNFFSYNTNICHIVCLVEKVHCSDISVKRCAHVLKSVLKM